MRDSKNVLIGGLIAIVILMSIGYAAFITNLSVTGTTSITSSWSVKFDDTKTSLENGMGVVTTEGTGSATAIEYIKDAYAVNLEANLQKPGDSVSFLLTIKNEGTLDAKIAKPSIASVASEGEEVCEVNDLTCTYTASVGNGQIIWTVEEVADSVITAKTGTTTMRVTATFVDNEVTSFKTVKIPLTITLVATQA